MEKMMGVIARHGVSCYGALGRLFFPLLLGGACSIQAAPAPTVMLSASVDAAADHTSITFESSRPITYKMFLLGDPDRLVVDMQNVKLDAVIGTLSSKLAPDDVCVKLVRSSNFKAGVVRVVFDLKGKVKPTLRALTPADGHQYQLLLDIYPREPLPKESPEMPTGADDAAKPAQEPPAAATKSTPDEAAKAAKPRSPPISDGSPNRIFDPTSPVTRVLHQHPTLEHFEFCQGGGCAEVDSVAVTEEEWKQVRAIFNPAANKAEDEREKIKQAIGLMERIVGPKTGTDTDRGGTFGNSHYPGQLDCHDESTNTTTYLRLMLQDRLLRFHHPVDTKTRGFFLNGWPHTTAVIQENEGGQKFAVDSWFYDNGEPPVILPLDVWRSGWKPENR